MARLIACLLALLASLATVALPASADPQDRLDKIARKRAELERKIEKAAARGDSLEERIANLDSDAQELQVKISGLDNQIAELDGRISEVQAKLTAAQIRLNSLEEDLFAIQKRLVRRMNLFTVRAVEAYKEGPSGYLDGLLSSESITDLVDRYEYYQSALDADARLINEIETLQSTTEQRRDQVEKEKKSIAAAKLALERDKEAVATVRAEKANALEAQEIVIAAKEDVLGKVTSRKQHFEKLDRKLADDSQRIQDLLQTGTTPSTAAPHGTGQFLWPANGPVTSSFGWRTHPIFGDRRFHAGVDIGAPYGSPVWAADDGVVAFAGVMSGYGNVVVVDHGGGLATTYNHLSAFLVGSGALVSRGQQIANVGCTGYCTGPHLHFEVRANGTPIDPMPYLQ